MSDIQYRGAIWEITDQSQRAFLLELHWAEGRFAWLLYYDGTDDDWRCAMSGLATRELELIDGTVLASLNERPEPVIVHRKKKRGRRRHGIRRDK